MQTNTANPAVATPTTIAKVAVAPAHSMPNANWVLTGAPYTGKAQAPGARTVAYAALAAMGGVGGPGCTMGQVAAAVATQVATQGLRGNHPAYQLLAWLATNRGYTFTCTAGCVVATVTPLAAPTGA